MHGTLTADAGCGRRARLPDLFLNGQIWVQTLGLFNSMSECFRRPASFPLVSFLSVSVTGLSIQESAIEMAVENGCSREIA